MTTVRKEVEFDVDIAVVCWGCGASLAVGSEQLDAWGDPIISVQPCKCQSHREADTMQARIRELEKTILETLDEHGDLADGDVCTLIKLKRVMGL